ncbi:unnamed protein product [Paramecium primaurelia]|uniref:Uncharacterized protein n=1 Tax=Paramecium primaurelia TaxID=5886 RepID=A0A8S1KAN5_PARPR|nr:unnamed protein product [Paramecium primaurelia]
MQLLNFGRQNSFQFIKCLNSSDKICHQNQRLKLNCQIGFKVPQKMIIQKIKLVFKLYKEIAKRVNKKLNTGYGHLKDQSLRNSSNKRINSNAQNIFKFLFEVVQLLIEIFRESRVRIKLSLVICCNERLFSKQLQIIMLEFTKTVHNKRRKLFLQLLHGRWKTRLSLQNGLESQRPLTTAKNGYCYIFQIQL